MKHPYESVADYQLHRHAVDNRPPAFFDPVAKPKFTVDAAIATMGSCFAQNLSRWLIARGVEFLRTEPTHEDAGGVFSANFGNVYTVAQALQLYRFAFGELTPSDELWTNAEGKFVDPLRPGPTHEGFDTATDTLAARAQHYRAVRQMFQEAPFLVFTLGLTEAWRRRSDGAVLPLAPGVVAGPYVPDDYEFVNFTYDAVTRDLEDFIACIARVNASARVILTVSPIPLAATYVDRNVAVSSMASKAILRAAADAVAAKYATVDYFPSFEIFFTPGIGSTYFKPDGRHVAESGVAHAMRVFERHYLPNRLKHAPRIAAPTTADIRRSRDGTWCDEDALAS